MMPNKFNKLSVVIPVFNEVQTIKKILELIESEDVGMEKEIIIVDDCSTDGTRDMLRGWEDKYRIYYQAKNQGKGAALRTGFALVTGDIALVQDADLEYSPSDYPKLLKPIIDGVADVVYGSRFLGLKEVSWRSKIVYRRGYLFSRALNLLSNIVSGLWLSDMYTCYKVFSRNALEHIYPHLKSKRFGTDPELTAWVAKFNFKIIEVPISYKGRTYAEGKKINWKDGLAALWHIIRFNWFTRK